MSGSTHRNSTQKLITKDPVNGAYTELFAGLSDEITEKNNGGWGKLKSCSRCGMLALTCSHQLLHLAGWQKGRSIFLILSLDASIGSGPKSRSGHMNRILCEKWKRLLLCHGSNPKPGSHRSPGKGGKVSQQQQGIPGEYLFYEFHVLGIALRRALLIALLYAFIVRYVYVLEGMLCSRITL